MMQFTSDREIDPFTAPSTLAIGTLHVHDRVAVGGVVTKLQQRHWSSGSQSLHATISDRTGSVAVVFLGRSHVAGVELGRAVIVAGAVIQRHGLRLIMNPYLWLTEVSGAELEAPGQGLTSTG